MVAKRLASRYLPGRRTDAWIKVKAKKTLCCAVLGFLPSGDDDFRSLIVAAPDEGGILRSAGKVGSGFSDRTRAELNALLRARPRARPLVACPFRGKWVEPGLYCRVSYLERTHTGQLYAPVFEELVKE